MINPYLVSEPVSESNELTEARREIARLADQLDHSVSFEQWDGALADLSFHMRQSEGIFCARNATASGTNL